jgi:hypothetical protein
MKLYEIAEQHNTALMAMSDMDDLPEEVIDDTLESLEGEFKDKALAVAAFFLNSDADIAAMKEAEKRIADRRKALEKKAASLKDYLLKNMQRTGITKIECPEFKIGIRNNPESVQIVDEFEIPKEFVTIVETVKIDKVAIKKAGGCPGVELVKTQSLTIK